MKKIINITLAVTLAALASCSYKCPIQATKNPIGSKVGTAERTIFLGIALGTTDLSLQTAAKNGKITKIATVDYEVKNELLWFVRTYRTIVTGE